MEIAGFTLHKIDHNNNNVVSQQATDNAGLGNYVKEILDKVSVPDEKRKYTFPEGSLVEPALAEMLDLNKFISRANNNANRLLTVELTTQEAMGHLMEIQRGILIQAIVNVNSDKKVILAKADFSEYLAEKSNYQREAGLPVKRKIFKAYCGSYDNGNVLRDIFVFDPLNTKYWWREFLELNQSNTDETNTEIAFDEIDSILQRFKQDYPADHNVIRNLMVGYFKTPKRQFSTTSLKKNIFTDYTPVESTFPLDKIKSKVDDLFKKNKFDGQFSVVPEKITAKKLREIIPLNEKMDLHIKDFIQNLNADVAPYKYKGEKYIRIRSDSGYKAFGGDE